jgi:hypothetical protein
MVPGALPEFKFGILKYKHGVEIAALILLSKTKKGELRHGDNNIYQRLDLFTQR